MERYYIYETSTGKLLQTGSCVADDIGIQVVPPGHSLALGDADVFGQYYDLVAEQLSVYPPKPSPFHVFDYGARVWVVSPAGLSDAVADRTAAVNALRDTKRNLPVLYEGKLFDADVGSVESMRETSDRIRRGDGLPSGWAGWRTYDNSMAWASETDAAVLEHLTAIRRMLEDRWQALLISAWGHKDVIAGLSDVGAVMDYDFSGGWPT